MKQRIKLLVLTAFILLAALIKMSVLVPLVEAKPAFMDRYNNDPFAKADLIGKCTVCHIGRGGGERNDFGEAFEDAGYRITPKLRAKFPQLFEQKMGNAGG